MDESLKSDVMLHLKWAIHHGQIPWKRGADEVWGGYGPSAVRIYHIKADLRIGRL